jgi:hypothetical protein
MRTKNFFRTIVAAALCAVISTSANAQALTTAHAATVDKLGANDAIDYVTIGAEVPYQITSSLPIWDLIQQGALVTSVYNWSIGAGPTIYDHTGAAPLVGITSKGTEVAIPAGFFNDTVISIKFPATGAQTLSVSERSVSNIAAVLGCDGATVTQNIFVTKRPTVDFNEVSPTVGGCSVDGSPFNIPITLSGSNNPQVTYGIQYTNLTGTSSPTVAAGTVIADAGFVAPTGWSAFSVDNVATHVAIPFTPTAAAYGKYVVTVTAVTDRISRKSLDIAVGGVSQDLGDVNTINVGVTTLTIWALPTPATQNIKHVTNLAW